MAKPDEITKLLKFALSDLKHENAHHEFEHLCRHLTRARICSNIRPATGPVSAGGDGGRDFETFPTYLPTQIKGVDNLFVGLASDRPIAFACSLRKDPERKVREDVESILTGSKLFKDIHFFSSNDVPVQLRQRIESDLHLKFGVTLTIHDRSAIAEMLAAPDVFWIASRFLSLPAEIAIEIPADARAQVYKETLARYQGDLPDLSWKTFYELRSVLRLTSRIDAYRAELSKWLDIAEQYLTDHDHVQFRRKLIYELVLAHLFGRQDIAPVHLRIREYFSDLADIDEPAGLEDAVGLFTYVANAYRSGHGGPPIQVSGSYFSLLRHAIETRASSATTASVRASCLNLLALLQLGWGAATNALEQAIPVVFTYWVPMSLLLDESPLLSLESIAKGLNEFAVLLDSSPDYPLVVERVDTALGARVGGFRQAQSARDRAIKFFDAGKTLRAIGEFHRVKNDWFSAETIRGCVLALAMLAESYRRLGLNYAAKLCYLSAQHIALGTTGRESTMDLVPKVLRGIALIEYEEGTWQAFLHVMRITMVAHQDIHGEPLQPEKSQRDKELVYYTTLIFALGPTIAPALEDGLKGLQQYPVFRSFDALIPAARLAFQGKSGPELLDETRVQIRALPFSDLARARRIRWTALGVKWEVVSRLDHHIAEEFVALLQLVLVEVATFELALLQTTVSIELSVGASSDVESKFRPSAHGRYWSIALPPPNHVQDEKFRNEMAWLTAVAFEILHDISMLSGAALMSHIESVVKGNVLGKFVFGDRYSSLYRAFYDSQTVIGGSLELMGESDWRPAHQELSWRKTRGAGYADLDVPAMLRKRYAFGVSATAATRRLLNLDPSFKDVVRRLRKDGWLDWQLLAAVLSVASSYRARQGDGNGAGALSRAEQLLRRETDEGLATVPPSEFTYESLARALAVGMLTTARMLGLELQENPEIDSVREFLAVRYGYLTDDITHPDPFE